MRRNKSRGDYLNDFIDPYTLTGEYGSVGGNCFLGPTPSPDALPDAGTSQTGGRGDKIPRVAASGKSLRPEKGGERGGRP
jgi:hypothetical protein